MIRDFSTEECLFSWILFEVDRQMLQLDYNEWKMYSELQRESNQNQVLRIARKRNFPNQWRHAAYQYRKTDVLPVICER